MIRIAPVDDAALEAIHTGSAVFRIELSDAAPHLGRTGVLRRRLKRLLRIPKVREAVLAIDYWPVGSSLESMLTLYGVAREQLPGNYIEFMKLRMPPYVKLVLSNSFPRTQITTRMAAGPAEYFGPFRTRASAELFEKQFLDLFQLRRCQEDLAPHPEHPGCMYGEMNMCLRPCQGVVGVEEYASEVHRVSDFLRSSGDTAVRGAEAARDRMSAELQFEAAAREHKRLERIQDVIKLRDDLVGPASEIAGGAVLPSVEPGAATLIFMRDSVWRRPITFSFDHPDQAQSMDRRLRETIAAIEPVHSHARDRQEHLAILARWYYSSWRDGFWIPFDHRARVPYRRLISAISRTVNESSTAASH